MGLYERFKAWRRGERVITGAERGRCFEKKASGNNVDTSGGSVVAIKAGPKIALKSMKVIRVDGTIEEVM